jgi:hypothetical protein
VCGGHFEQSDCGDFASDGKGMPCRTRRDAYDGGLVFGLIGGRRYGRVAAPHFIKEGRLGEINA